MGQTKVVLIGDTQVGKTSIVSFLKNGHVDPSVSTTIGASFQTHFVQTNNETVSFQIWDTAGQERFRALTPLYYRTALWAILVFDITNKISFDNLNSWIENLKEKMEEGMKLVIVGNKVDLPNKVISSEEAQNFSQQVGAQFYIETSAFSGVGINELFQKLADFTLNFSTTTQVVSVPKPQQQKETNCC